MRTTIALAALCAVFTNGCGDDDDSTPTPDAGSTDGGTTADGSTGSTDFTLTIENVGTRFPYQASGVFNTPTGASAPGPIMTNGSYEWTFTAARAYPTFMDETRLSFATMLVGSNDLFFAPAATGMPLFDDTGMPIVGDRTAEVEVWDAGTEADEALGGSTANRPPNAGVGPVDPTATVRLASATPIYSDIAAADAFIRLDVAATETDRAWVFTVTLTNVSADAATPLAVATPVSPGVWVVHNQPDSDPGPLFTVGEADRGEGLEAIAEDGDASALGAALEADTGLTLVSSPGVWAVHTAADPFFTSGQADRGDGLEAIAEDGMAATLATALMSQTGITSSGTVSDMPFGPGGMATVSFSADPGDRFSFVTMVVPSNDVLFTFDPAGIELFDSAGAPVTGTIAGLEIWDAGTEVDQTPGVGLDQVHLQAAPNTGAVDPDNTVRELTSSAFDPSTLSITIATN